MRGDNADKAQDQPNTETTTPCTDKRREERGRHHPQKGEDSTAHLLLLQFIDGVVQFTDLRSQTAHLRLLLADFLVAFVNDHLCLLKPVLTVTRTQGQYTALQKYSE